MIVWGNQGVGTGDDIYLSVAPFYGTVSGINIDYSIVGETEVALGNYITGSHIYTADPGLNDSYALTRGSFAVNAGQCGRKTILGVYRRVAPYDDIDGDKRPGFGQLTGCDIGADEYNALLCFPVRNHNGGMTIICF